MIGSGPEPAVSRPPTPPLSCETRGRVHFVGVAGAGMSALAAWRAAGGLPTSGSDRAFDRGDAADERARLAAWDVEIHPQDGRGIAGAAQVVCSGAVEAEIPDLVEARRRGVPLVHRAELLAAYAAESESVAVAGSSGKSTVTAMVFGILRAAGRDPGLLTGGELLALRDARRRGNAHRASGPLVFEADESDGTLVRHAPHAAVVLNLHRDHMEPDAVLLQFRTLQRRTRGPVVVPLDPALAALREGALTFGFAPGAEVRGEALRLHAEGSTFLLGGRRVHVPLPGRHNAANALAALATSRALQVPDEVAIEALGRFGGVLRRFEVVGRARGVTVVDDYAHNPTKIGAALRAAQGAGARVLALFQPHGFGPTRFMRAELVETLRAVLRPEDHLWLAPIYYAGGTVARDVSSADLVDDLRAAGRPAELLEDRAAFAPAAARLARAGDVVIVIGGRDPGLAALARAVLAALGAPAAEASGPSGG